MAAAHALTTYKTTSTMEMQILNQSTNGSDDHILEKFSNSRRCYMCQYGYLNRKTSNNSTLFKCAFCGVLVCKSFKGDCWNMHLKGLPKKKKNRIKIIRIQAKKKLFLI